MTWYRKEQPTPFDQARIDGLFFLDGDVLAREIKQAWTKGQKYPMVAFPSGLEFAIWESGNPEIVGIVHLFGELDMPYRETRDVAFEHAANIAEQCGYRAEKMGEDQLRVVGRTSDEHYLITYQEGRMVDIEQLKENWTPPLHPGHQLMTDEIRQALPPLYTGEEIGLEAVAPVKYFTPDSQWTWYPTEFDGDDLMFGLVAGFEVEVGYFSLSELRDIRGPLGLPVERDLHYTPESLKTLMEYHKKFRGE